MPSAPLVAASIELAINTLISLDIDVTDKLERLANRRLVVELTDIKQTLVLAFSHRIDVLVITDPVELSVNDCAIKTQLSTLPYLRDASQLTQMIKSEKLEVSGDLSVAQLFSDMMQSLNIDWEELLALRTSDVVANQVFCAAKQVAEHVKTAHVKLSRIVASGLTDEKQLAAHKLAVLHYSDQVSGLRDDVERLEARLTRLERISK